ncbi:hypothetical protein ABW20_dc0102738 [Dactylellina cionopaga]|nr:hypothetical protein ABW20_dc0102738 [Dactylellina cionopaga]
MEIRSFLGQVPFTLLALVMVAIKLKIADKGKGSQKQTLRQRFQRIDFLGAISLAASLSLFLVFLDGASKGLSFTDPVFLGAGIGSVTIGITFLIVEAYVAKEPILCLQVLTKRDVVSVYTVLGFTTGSQLAVSKPSAVHNVGPVRDFDSNSLNRLALLYNHPLFYDDAWSFKCKCCRSHALWEHVACDWRTFSWIFD